MTKWLPSAEEVRNESECAVTLDILKNSRRQWEVVDLEGTSSDDEMDHE